MSAAAAAAANKLLKLKSSDDKEFVVEESIVVQSLTIKNMVDDDCAGTTIPLPNVTSKILAMVIEFCTKHADQTVGEKDLKNFDSEFVKKDLPELFDLVLAANYLEIKGLFDVISQQIADEIKEKPHQEVRRILNVQNDYTPEEEREVRSAYEWAFEGFP